MGSQRTKFHRVWKQGLLVAASTAGISAWVSPASAQEEAVAIEEVVVTGSRIARKDYTSSSPILTVGEEALKFGADVTPDASLNRLPQFVGANSGSTNFAGTGQANLNLRGLGAQRTLVLLDGRRMQPSNADNSVDVTTVPTALLESVEVITGGASAVYGSDAIAGVVNFRLRRDFTGLQINAQYGQTEQGDGKTRDIAATLGGPFADGRGRAVLSVNYSERDGVIQEQRPDFFELSALATSIAGGLVPTQGNPWTQAALNGVFAGYGVQPGALNRNTTAIGFNTDGTLFSSGSLITNYKGPTDGGLFYVPPGATSVQIKTGLQRYLQLPLTRNSVFARGEYDVTDRVQAFVQANFTDYDATTALGALNAGGTVGLTVAANNPFIPAGLATLLASRANPNAPFSFITNFEGLLPTRASTFSHSTYQIVGGLSGEAGYRDWSWNAYFAYGKDSSEQIAQGFGSKSAIQSLLMAADGGRSLCQGGWNPFGLGRPMSQACVDYVSRTLHTTTTFEQREAAAGLQGGLLALPAGELRFAVGADWRRNTYDYVPDQVAIIGDAITFPQSFPTQGAVNVAEIYGELLVPLLADLPFVEILNLELAYRYSDYNTIGGAGTYKANADWTIGAGLMVRGGFQRAIRAPSIGELYAAPQSAFVPIGNPTSGGRPAFAGDPCDVRSAYRTGPGAPQVRALCIAQGVPTSAIDGYTFGTANMNVITAGNTTLQEETADSYTVGAVWRSQLDHPLLSGLSASVDYYSIKVSDAIGVLGISATLQSCFNANGLNPSYDPTNPYCALLKRDPLNGSVTSETQQPRFNLAAFETTGLDYSLNWGFGLGDIGLPDHGRLTIDLAATQLLSFKSQNFATAPFLDYRGTIGAALTNPYSIAYPEWKGQAGVTWSDERFEAGLRLRYIDAMKDFSTVANPASSVPGVPRYWYTDLNLGWKIRDGLEVRGGVTNLFDKAPPVVGGVAGTTDPTTYDLLGRSYFLALKAKF